MLIAIMYKLQFSVAGEQYLPQKKNRKPLKEI